MLVMLLALLLIVLIVLLKKFIDLVPDLSPVIPGVVVTQRIRNMCRRWLASWDVFLSSDELIRRW